VWLSVWSEVQTCIWPSWCHCHSLSLASVKSRLVSPFWYWLTWVVPDKGSLNVCVYYAFSALTLLVGRQEEHSGCKNWVVRCWCYICLERGAYCLHILLLCALWFNIRRGSFTVDCWLRFDFFSKLGPVYLCYWSSFFDCSLWVKKLTTNKYLNRRVFCQMFLSG